MTAKGFPYYVNTISSIIKKCIGNPRLSAKIRRYPIIPDGSYKLVCHLSSTIATSVLIFFFREMYHASRWHNNPRYFSPMTILQDGTHVFIRDCVMCKHPFFEIVTAIVNKFVMQVCTYNIGYVVATFMCHTICRRVLANS